MICVCFIQIQASWIPPREPPTDLQLLGNIYIYIYIYIWMKLIYVCVKSLSFRNAVSCWGRVYSFSSWTLLDVMPPTMAEWRKLLSTCRPSCFSFPSPGCFPPGVTILPIYDQLFFFFTILVIITCFLHWQCVVRCACRASPSSPSVRRTEKMKRRGNIFHFRSPGGKNSHFLHKLVKEKKGGEGL